MDSSLNTDGFIMELAIQRKPKLKLLLICHEFMGVTWNLQCKYTQLVTVFIKELCGQELSIFTYELMKTASLFFALLHNGEAVNGSLVQK